MWVVSVCVNHMCVGRVCVCWSRVCGSCLCVSHVWVTYMDVGRGYIRVYTCMGRSHVVCVAVCVGVG